MAEREYTVVAPDGKELTLIGPVGATNDQVIAQAKKLYNSTPQNLGTPIYGDLPTAIGGKPNIIGYKQQPVKPPRNLIDYAVAPLEIPLTVVSGAVAPFAGTVAGMYENMVKGTDTPVNTSELAQRFTYQPKSSVSQDVLESMGEALTAAKIPAYMPALGTTARATQQAGKTTAPMVSGNLPSYDQLANKVKPAVNRLAEALREPEVSTMPGVGAALVPDAQVRMARALNLPVPIKLSKGEALRELGQQQFEAEIAKTYPKDVGRPLIAGKMNRNEQLLQNFDAYVDATGAKEAGEFNLRQVGQVVDSALVNKANKAKKEIGDAYKLAREAGEDAELVDVRSVQNYLNDLEPESINAPVITSAKMKLDKLAKDGQISLNALEEVRKMVNTLSGDTTSNMAFGKQIKDQIDLTTVGKGGELYQKARKLRENYSREFENVGYIDKLLSKKKGTSDRVVALEDVFKHSILDGSLDDVRSIGRTLKKAGSEGEQAWKELQGQTIEQMKSLVSKSVQRDELGNPIVSPAKFDGFVKQLDADGKLDYLFGKKGAQQIRDLRDATLDINVPMQGINQSNTSSALTQALDRIKGSALSKLPLAGPLFEVGAEIIEKRKLAKEVDEALNFDPNNLAKELRKGK
jgi:hypothetical protein